MMDGLPNYTKLGHTPGIAHKSLGFAFPYGAQ
jgi:hypothetical protein